MGEVRKGFVKEVTFQLTLDRCIGPVHLHGMGGTVRDGDRVTVGVKLI